MSARTNNFFGVDDLRGRIDEVLRRDGSGAVWGYLVHSTGLNRDVAWNANADVALIPASNVKLITCAAALLVSHVGPKYRFETSAHLSSLVDSDDGVGGTCKQRSLYVTPTGDPTLTSRELRRIVRRASAAAEERNVHVRVELVGKPWVDEGPHPTWEAGDLGERWAAPPSRTVLDGNVFSTSSSNGDDGEYFHHSPPRSPRSRFIALATAFANDTNFYIDDDEDDEDGEDEKARGVEVEESLTSASDGGVGETRALRVVVARRMSRSVASLVRTTLEKSDNLYAEQLLRTMSGGRDSGRWLTSWSTVFFNKHCLHPCSQSSSFSSSVPRRIRLVDGSGLSRHNLAPPRAFVVLLLAVLVGARREEEEKEEEQSRRQEQKDNNEERKSSSRQPCVLFLDSLPVAGRTGTLSDRFVGTQAEGTVRAKTGAMTGVAALSGVFQPPAVPLSSSAQQQQQHSTTGTGAMVFSIIVNNAVADGQYLRAVIDEIVTLITLAR